jgi:hypothetical protein
LLLGHNLWIVREPADEEKEKIKLITGDSFPESEVAIRAERIKEFKILTADQTRKVTDFQIEGSSLTTTIAGKPYTAFVAAVELFPNPIILEAEKFAHYIEEEDAWAFTFPAFTPTTKDVKQRESYAKFAKALIKNSDGSSDIFTSEIGHRLEIVPVELPETAVPKMRVQVLFEGQPIANLRVSGGAQGLNNGLYLAHARTNQDGFAEIEIYPEKLQFLRTHFIRRHPDSENFEWESFWASVTFCI